MPLKYIAGILLVIFIYGATTVASDTCLPGFQCVHGVCTSGTTCQCDSGWSGDFCHVPDTANDPVLPSTAVTTPLTSTNTDFVTSNISGSGGGGGGREQDAGEDLNEDKRREVIYEKRECIPGYICVHGVCETDSISCRCDEGWTGEFCQNATITTGSDNNTFTQTITSPISAVTSGGNFSPLDGYGPLADLSVRKCADTFECQYGNCSKDAFVCICEPGFVGVFCHQPCPLNCGPHGTCVEKPIRCECDQLYSGKNCSVFGPLDKYREAESESYWYAVGLCIGVVVMLVVVLVLVPYLLWRRGNIAMLKLVFWFQSIEEDDGRMYDAFVSYASTEADRQFVMECLIPNLEDQMAFTLCIHERDFMPGKYITSNIMDSVRQSRRTLLVISPSFMSRNWCQFEFQMAVAEMIEQKHRILPVILGDLHVIKQASNIDNTFQRVLNTVTYLEYPGNDASEQELQRFWKRLELSMPKKTTNQSASGNCSPAPTPTSITPLSIPYKNNGVIFPSKPYKLCIEDDITVEPSINSNQNKSNILNHPSSSRHSDKTSFVGWFRKLFRRRKMSPKSSVCIETHSSNHPSCIDKPLHVTSDTDLQSQKIDIVTCSESEKQTNGKHKSSDTKQNKKEEVNPSQIELSGWTWPSPNSMQEIC